MELTNTSTTRNDPIQRGHDFCNAAFRQVGGRNKQKRKDTARKHRAERGKNSAAELCNAVNADQRKDNDNAAAQHQKQCERVHL